MATPNPFREPSDPISPSREIGASNPFRESEKDIGPLAAFTELSKGLVGGLTLNNLETLGYAIEALGTEGKKQKRAAGPFATLRGPRVSENAGVSIQKWVQERRGKQDKDDRPISKEEAKEAGFWGTIAYYSSQLGQGLGSTAVPLAAGAVGAVAGSAVLPGPGTVIGGFAGAMSAGALMNVGETFRQLKDEGVPIDTAKRWSVAIAPVIGALEATGLSKILGATVAKGIKKKAIAEIVKQIGAAGAKGFAAEGATEAMQSAVREATAAALTGNLDLKRRALAALEEGFVGGLVGGTMGGGGRIARIALPGVDPDAGPTQKPPPGLLKPLPSHTPAPVVEPKQISPEPAPISEPAPAVKPEPISPPAGAESTATPESSPSGDSVPATIPVEANPFRDATIPTKPIEGPIGKETVLHYPSGEVRARYRLVESGTLQPSHDPVTFAKNENYPEGVQERTYHSNKNAQAEVINVSKNLKPELIINSDPTAINGPPQGTPTGVVLGGNQRDMATQRMYLDGKGAKYLQYLTEHAEEYGFTKEQVGALKNPELFREILDAPADIEGMRVMGRELNRSFTKALSEVEEAVSAGKNLSSESAEQIAVELEKQSEAGSLRTLMASNPLVFREALLRDGVISKTDLPQYFTKEGALNEAGKHFIERSMVGSVVQDADLLQSMPKSLWAKVERIIPQMIELRNRSDDWNIAEDFREALSQISSAHIRGIEIVDQLKQKTMFLEGPNEKVKAIAKTLTKKPLEVAQAFKAFVKDARIDVKDQVAMFGSADPNESFARIFGVDPVAVQSAEATAAMIPEEGTYAFAGERPQLPGTQKTEMPEELVRRSEILDKLSKELGGLPIRIGRIGTKKALGIYKPKAKVIRLRQANEISVAMHEIGHHLNKVMYAGPEGKLNTKPLMEFKDELSKIATKGESMTEGFAEFVRLYLTSPGEAMDVAPRFHAAFEKKMAEMPELKDILIGTRKQIRLYLEQPAVAKTMAHIRLSSERPRSKWSVDQIYKDIFNKQHPIEKAVKKMESLKGEKLPTEKNAASLAQLVSGWSDRARLYLSKTTFDIKGEINGPGLDTIIAPLVKSGQRQALDAYLVARRIVADSRGIKTGLPLDVAKKTVQDLGTEEFQTVAKGVYAFQDRLLDLRVQAGLLTKKEAADYRKANPDFVPLRKFFPEKAGDPLGSKGFLNLGGGKRRKGSEREVISPLESIVVDVESTIRDVDHHVAVRAFVEQAAAVEGGGVFAEKVPAQIKGTAVKLSDLKKALSENGINTDGMSAKAMESVVTVFRPDLRPDPGENIEVVRNKKGERELWQLDPDVHKAFESSSPVSSNVFTKILRGGAATLRTTATGTSLEFPMMNFFRDTIFAGLVSPDGFIPVLSSLKGTLLYVSNNKVVDEFFRAGGGLSTNVEVALNQMGKSNNPLKSTPIMNVWQVATALSRVSEMGTRIGYYNVARKAGKSPKEAALGAKDLLNFSRWGAATEAVARYTPFYNSALQGVDKFRRALVEDPKGVTARGVAMITVPSILVYAANYGNKDYEEAPPWLKDLFWLIPTFDKKTPFIRLPKPHLPGMLFGSLPERAMDFARTRDPKAFDGVMESLLKTTLPGMGGVPVPSLAIPIIEGVTNYSFFRGRPIVPHHLERFPAKYQSQPWTTEIAKETSKMMSAVGVEMSPLKIENTLFGITASTGRTLAVGLNPFLRDKDAPKPPSMHWGDVPVVRAFAVRPIVSGVSVQQLYDRLEKLEGMEAAESLSRENSWISAKRMSSAEHREYKLLKDASRRMSDIFTKIRRIESSKQTGDQKRKNIDNLNTKRMKIAVDVMKKAIKIRK